MELFSYCVLSVNTGDKMFQLRGLFVNNTAVGGRMSFVRTDKSTGGPPNACTDTLSHATQQNVGHYTTK